MTPKLVKTLYTSEQLTESCGAILFDLHSHPAKVCLIHFKERDEWLLAKGRRDAGESRGDAAVREVMEETGYKCHLHAVDISSRQPPAGADPNVPNSVFEHRQSRDWFATQTRGLQDSHRIKQIWWYIAVLDDVADQKQAGEEAFAPEFLSYDDALQRLTFDDDRTLLRRAIEIVGQHR